MAYVTKINGYDIKDSEARSDVSTLQESMTTAQADIETLQNDLSDTKADLGDITALDTTVKTSTVSAINEVKGEADDNATAIGTLSSLSTTDKTDLVSAVNEVVTAIGNEATARENAIKALDAAAVGGSGKYIESISEKDGVISATEKNFGSVEDSNAYPVTGGSVYASLCARQKLLYRIPRWLRFSANDRKSLVIKAGTMILVGTYIYEAVTDQTYSMGNSLTAGKDYFVYLNYNDGSWTVTCSLTKSADTSTSRYIGRFHTLCNAVPSNSTNYMKIPDSPGGSATSILVKSYKQDEDPDFYTFYNKSVVSREAGAYYDVVTVEHTLAGYLAGDILPESVMCLSWGVNTLHDDAMVYDKDTDVFVDVYLQSGTGVNTKSAYNETHTVSRAGTCHQEDMRQVGKKLLSDYEFSSAAIGGNECTTITGSSDKGSVGGHVDTNDKRMVSAIGCEEMAGYLWAWLDEFIYANSSSGWQTIDNQNSFGQQYWGTHQLVAGGSWGSDSGCGSLCRRADFGRAFDAGDFGGRGSSRVVRGIR